MEFFLYKIIFYGQKYHIKKLRPNLMVNLLTTGLLKIPPSKSDCDKSTSQAIHDIAFVSVLTEIKLKALL